MKELDQGAWPFLSTECQALYDWQKGLPASCKDDVRNANRRQIEDEAQKRASLLAVPGIRFCLGLRPLEEADSGRTPRGAPESLGDQLYAAGARDDEDRKLQAALDDPSGVLEKCMNRIAAAGGLAFIDPANEFARVNRIPRVKQASDRYAKCATDRAAEFARVSNESAETIANAALGGCSILRANYLATLARALGIVMTREIAAQEEKEISGALIGQVIAERAKAAGRAGSVTPPK